MKPPSKLYCFVDETGQDYGSSIFIVVVVATTAVDEVRSAAARCEFLAGVGAKKWHKSKLNLSLSFLGRLLATPCEFTVYYLRTVKPATYAAVVQEAIYRTIVARSVRGALARVHVDGISKRNARELTISLRRHGLNIAPVRSRRDESEPLIRVADRFAGCLRSALAGNAASHALVRKAVRLGKLQIAKPRLVP